MGRTIPSWRIVQEEETCRLRRFKQLLRAEERVVVDDLLNQCKLYAAQTGCLKLHFEWGRVSEAELEIG
jgi:hypothetical protein